MPPALWVARDRPVEAEEEPTLRCRTVLPDVRPPPPETIIRGDRVPDPTEVELGEAGYESREGRGREGEKNRYFHEPKFVFRMKYLCENFQPLP